MPPSGMWSTPSTTTGCQGSSGARLLAILPHFRILHEPNEGHLDMRCRPAKHSVSGVTSRTRQSNPSVSATEPLPMGLVALSVNNCIEAKAYLPEEVRELAIRKRRPYGRPQGCRKVSSCPTRSMLLHRKHV